LSDRGKYTTYKVRKELGDIVDTLIQGKYKTRLAVIGMDNRSGFITYLLLELAKHEGLIDEVDPSLKEAYSRFFNENTK